MRILGLSFDYHDAAAALVVDGVPVAAAQEERFTRVKHDRRLPESAARWCLGRAGLEFGDLDAVVFYEKPFRKLTRILAGSIATFPSSAALFRRAAGAWLDERLWVGPRIERAFDLAPGKVLFCEHHLSHAASAFFASPFDEAAVLTIDGVGEWATASVGRGRRGAGRLHHLLYRDGCQRQRQTDHDYHRDPRHGVVQPGIGPLAHQAFFVDQHHHVDQHHRQ